MKLTPFITMIMLPIWFGSIILAGTIDVFYAFIVAVAFPFLVDDIFEVDEDEKW